MIHKGFNRNKIKFLLLTFSFINLNKNTSYISQSNAISLTESTSKIDDKNINESPYIIGPGDVIEIKILDAENLDEVNVVLNDGTLSVPEVIGNLKVSGLSIIQARAMIQKELNKELINPNVRIVVKDPRRLRIAVLGEVQFPESLLFQLLIKAMLEEPQTLYKTHLL